MSRVRVHPRQEQQFTDRSDAGRKLAVLLVPLQQRLVQHDKADENTMVLGLARGGVPVACEVAQALGLPLDVMVVRKLGAPNEPEFAMGAIAPGGVIVVNEAMPRCLLQSSALERETRVQLTELHRRESMYRTGRAPLVVAGRTVILVDDGAATGSSMLAAVCAIRQLRAREIIVALPVAAKQAREKLRGAADRVICVQVPKVFDAVGYWYHDFDQTTDRQVCALLERSMRSCRARGPYE